MLQPRHYRLTWHTTRSGWWTAERSMVVACYSPLVARLLGHYTARRNGWRLIRIEVVA